MSAVKKRCIDTTWKVLTHDVWGNVKDGYEVNDNYGHGEVPLRLVVETYNPGTPHAFDSAYPTDAQIRAIFGFPRVQIETDGDDINIYVRRVSDSYPIGTLYCTSHDSLSPIRAKVCTVKE